MKIKRSQVQLLAWTIKKIEQHQNDHTESKKLVSSSEFGQDSHFDNLYVLVILGCNHPVLDGSGRARANGR